ncbi:hypothetical protein PVAND_014434 [Polypedilum vanderplanki]|uniref:Uncharacterized protein n=1 Tax=Polypedilum vanderplanki TaxID=319348 RepID=A0A9J6B9N8_POLVA|nr:hypothetical protein PVAND_014434 [Polypedilum vanderplanki]
MTFYYKSKTDSNYREVLGVPQIEACKVLKYTSDNFLTKAIIESIQSVAPNIVHECPYSYLRTFNVTPPYHSILETTPSGDFKYTLKTQFGKDFPKDVNITIWFSQQSFKDKLSKK